MDWIDKKHNEHAKQFLGEIKAGYWVNLTDCYGDVWQRVLSVHEHKENPIRSFVTLARKTEKRGVKVIISELESFYSIRRVSESLPSEARIIVDENEYIDKIYPNHSFKI